MGGVPHRGRYVTPRCGNEHGKTRAEATTLPRCGLCRLGVAYVPRCALVSQGRQVPLTHLFPVSSVLSCFNLSAPWPRTSQTFRATPEQGPTPTSLLIISSRPGDVPRCPIIFPARLVPPGNSSKDQPPFVTPNVVSSASARSQSHSARSAQLVPILIFLGSLCNLGHM
jgi:hypothetical protein